MTIRTPSFLRGRRIARVDLLWMSGSSGIWLGGGQQRGRMTKGPRRQMLRQI